MTYIKSIIEELNIIKDKLELKANDENYKKIRFVNSQIDIAIIGLEAIHEEEYIPTNKSYESDNIFTLGEKEVIQSIKDRFASIPRFYSSKAFHGNSNF